MKLHVLQSNFSHSLSIVSRFASQRAQLPILSNIHLKTERQKLILSATNLENSASITLGAKVDEEGEITLPAKNLTEIINNLNDEQVSLEMKKENVLVSTPSFNATLNGINASDFPNVPRSIGKEKIEFNFEMFKSALDKVYFSTSNDETRPILTGILFNFKDGLSLVSTDGFRLSEMNLEIKSSQDGGYILPKNILSELMRLNVSDEKVSISFDKENSQVIFGVGEGVYSSRILSGEFPDYKKRIPTDFSTTLDLDVADFDQAIKIASVIARDSANVVKLSTDKKKLMIYSESTGSGKQETSIPVSVEGKDIKVAFNYKYLQEVIKQIGSDSVQINLNESDEPVIFKDKNEPGFLHMVMPLKL